jgi:hypothetical protein
MIFDWYFLLYSSSLYKNEMDINKNKNSILTQNEMNGVEKGIMEAELLTKSLSLYNGENRDLIIAFSQTIPSMNEGSITSSPAWIYILSNILKRLESGVHDFEAKIEIYQSSEDEHHLNTLTQLKYEMNDLSGAIDILYNSLVLGTDANISVPILWYTNTEKSLEKLESMYKMTNVNDIRLFNPNSSLQTDENSDTKSNSRKFRNHHIKVRHNPNRDQRQKSRKIHLMAKRYLDKNELPSEENIYNIYPNEFTKQEHCLYRIWADWYIFGRDETLDEIIVTVGERALKAYLKILWDHRNHMEKYHSLGKNIKKLSEKILFESLIYNPDFLDKMCEKLRVVEK